MIEDDANLPVAYDCKLCMISYSKGFAMHNEIALDYCQTFKFKFIYVVFI